MVRHFIALKGETDSIVVVESEQLDALSKLSHNALEKYASHSSSSSSASL